MNIQSILQRFPLGKALVQDGTTRNLFFAVGSLILNLLYAFYHGALGLVNHSLWFGSSCIYYLLLSALRFAALLAHRREKQQRIKATGGILLALLSLVLAGILYLSLEQNTATRYGSITMITIATYTFTKLTVAIISAVRKATVPSPALAVVRTVRYAELAVAVLTMQRSMLVSFGEMPANEIWTMNALTGTAVWLFVLFLGMQLCKTNRRKGG